MHGGCVIHDNVLPCESLVLKHCGEINNSDRLLSAVVSDCINVSSPLISFHSSVSLHPTCNQTSLVDITPESVVTSERTNAGSISQNNLLTVFESSALHTSMPPSDRLSDIQLLEENTANRASSNVSVRAAEMRTKPLFDDCCVIDISSQLDSCMKESSLTNDLHSLPVDGVNATLSSTIGVRNCDYVLHSGQLPEINRIHIEGEKSVLEVNSILKKHYAPTGVSPPMSVSCMSDCVLPNATVATDSSQNGLSVGQIVSCFKSITAMAKSQKTAHHKGELHIFLDVFTLLNCSVKWGMQV